MTYTKTKIEDLTNRQKEAVNSRIERDRQYGFRAIFSFNGYRKVFGKWIEGRYTRMLKVNKSNGRFWIRHLGERLTVAPSHAVVEDESEEVVLIDWAITD